MIAIPALDVRDGACVQLGGVSCADERVRRNDPLAIARQWCDYGFARLHLMDLNGALGKGDNSAIVHDILQEQIAEVQVGGGIRSTSQVEDMLAAGAHAVIVGIRAIEDLSWLSEITEDYPQTVIVAADVRDRRLTRYGRQRTLPRSITDYVEELNRLPFRSLLVTAVQREGQLGGADLNLMEDVVEAAAFPVLAAGGVADMDDLWSLQDRGVSGVVIGMALYSGVLDPRLLVEEFSV